eukprot:TRINITY_DN36177_c0_g1_i1.p1 TRINITY_DN36177_c0_g1~~TRINITY_DN36177_c0_g1_i1.p1  ORF type:complete len:198 (-),score=31.02 TRINITY_DN36177_c0_g1_i1:100-693(-)
MGRSRSRSRSHDRRSSRKGGKKADSSSSRSRSRNRRSSRKGGKKADSTSSRSRSRNRRSSRKDVKKADSGSRKESRSESSKGSLGKNSGVEVVTIKPGDRKTFPQKGDRLTMHYTGTLASNGKKFDSSYGKGKPFTFRIGIGQVIKGWDEGVMKMSLGEKATLKVKAEYGYGSAGAGGAIPANADLNFEVELLKIQS